MDFTSLLFYVLVALTGASAIGVVVTQNIVRAAAWLLFALAGTAGIFFLLAADFVGATQLLVYVGGTLVLVVFGVMLTAQGPFINLRISAVEWALAAGVGLVLFGVLAVSVWQVEPPAYVTAAVAARDLPSSATLGEALLGIEEATPMTRYHTDRDPYRAPDTEKGKLRDLPHLARKSMPRVGKKEPPDESPDLERIQLPGVSQPRKRMTYLLPFEIVSVHLLVVLIGAAYLARAKRRRVAPEQQP